jgi:hypothetical protein
VAEQLALDRDLCTPDAVDSILRGATIGCPSAVVTSAQDNKIFGFAAKLLLGMLPTMSRQHAWYTAYRDGLCRRCGDEEETAKHLGQCRDSQAAIVAIQRGIKTALNRHLPPDIVERLPQESLLIRGVPSADLCRHLQIDVKTETGLRELRKLTRAAIEGHREHIWLQRVEQTVRWEREQGIRQKHKRVSRQPALPWADDMRGGAGARREGRRRYTTALADSDYSLV